jgi:hypothetical protein
MMFPLVLELAADRVPIAVICRALGFSKQAFFKWRANPASQRDWDNAHLTNAAIDLHRDDPEPIHLRRDRSRSRPQGIGAAGVVAVLRAEAVVGVLEEAGPEQEGWTAGP